MKLNKMKWLGAILGVLLLFIASCESDNYSKDIDAEKPFKEVLKIGDFKNEFLKKNINSKEFLYNLIVDNSTQSNSKSNPLSVELSSSDVVKLISKDNLITYTANVKTSDTDSRDHFYKLVIITQDNKYDTKLLKFLPNVIEDNTANSSFKGTILNMPLEGNSLSAKSCGSTFTVEVFVPCIIHGELSPTDGCWGGHWETQVVDGCGGGGATTWTDNSGNIGGGGDGSYTYNGVYPIYTYSSAEVKQMFDNFVLNELNSEQQGFLVNNPSTSDAIKEYLSANVSYPEGFKSEAKEFTVQLLNLANVETNKADVNALVNISLIIEKGNYYENPLDESFLTQIDPYVDLDLGNPPSTFNPYSFTLSTYLKYRKLRQINPEWSRTTCMWHAARDLIHLSLDAFGLIPVGGEIADLANGVLYTLEGDGLNATLSYASAVPLIGYGSTATKFSLKIVNEVRDINSKVKLVWRSTANIIEFSSSASLRKVLGITSSSLHAHHIIPKGIYKNTVIQRAARSSHAFHIDEALNGMPIDAWRNTTHPNYNDLIKEKLDEFIRRYPNASPDACYNHLIDVIQDAKQAIINNPNVKLQDLRF